MQRHAKIRFDYSSNISATGVPVPVCGTFVAVFAEQRLSTPYLLNDVSVHDALPFCAFGADYYFILQLSVQQLLHDFHYRVCSLF